MRVTAAHHTFTGSYFIISSSAWASLNHGRAGLVRPDIMPAARMRTSRRPVLS
jgi:hypothetical protein